MLGKLNLIEKDDVVKFVSQKDIKLLNLCHIPEDGRLKTLSFAVSDEKRVKEILEYGERVDGSSLFSFINPDKSDVYVAPKLDSAFLVPFGPVPTLSFMCRYLDEDGRPLNVAPESILLKAESRLRSSTDVNLKAFAELEFFIISKAETESLFPGTPDKNYHESAPFSRFEHVRNEILVALCDLGVSTKYGHSEVGKILSKDGTLMEQHEVEFSPQNLVEMAETIAVAKWVIRNICLKHGVSVTFAPKISLEHAGNGMHIHLCGLRNGKNVIVDPNGGLSVEAKEMIGGILKLASSLSAFGNPTPASYLRFLARKESPINICWGARNRMALIRVPLWWAFRRIEEETDPCRRTFELRSPDAFANTYLLFAGLATAVEHGLKNHEESLKTTEELHIEAKGKKSRKYMQLPKSCSEAAKALKKDRKYYEADGVFPASVIDSWAGKLKSYKDDDLSEKIRDEPQRVEKLMQSYLHFG